MAYKVGDKIRFIGDCVECKNKTGTVIRIIGLNYAFIHLPDSFHIKNFPKGMFTPCSQIQLIKSTVGKQLEFAFMQG